MVKKYIKFFGSRNGCKMNDQKYYLQYLPNDNEITTVVEGYGGSFSLIRCHYYKTDKVLHVNDNDKQLIDKLLLLKDYDKTKLLCVIDEYNKSINPNYALKYDLSDKIPDDDIRFTIMDGYKFRGNLYKKSPFKEEDITRFQDLLKRCIITNKDISEIMNQYKDNEDVFLFLDPPYLNSDNTQYKGQTKYTAGKKLSDNTEQYINVLEFLKVAKCKVMAIINKTAITSYLYKDFIKGEYNKIYQASKNIATHLIICNY